MRALEGIHRGLGGRKAFPGPGPQAVTGFLFWPPTSGQGPHPREAQSLALCPWKGGPWVVAGVGGALRGQEGRGGPSVLRRQGPGTPAPAQLLPSVSLPAGRSRGPAGLYIFLTGPSSEARKEQQWSSPHGDPFVR